MSKSARRLLSVVELVALADAPPSLTELSQQLDLDKSTVARHLETLESIDYVARDSKSKRYRIGPSLLSLTAAIAKRAEILRLARPYLEDIRDSCNETTSYHLRVGLERVCVDAVDRFPPQIGIRPLGIRRPLFAGTSGRVILAFVSEAHQEAVFEQARTAGIDTSKLTKDIQSARLTGALYAYGDANEKSVTVSSALFNDRSVFGAITVTGPEDRWSLEKAAEFASVLSDRTRAISAAVVAAGIPTYQDAFEGGG